MTDVERSRLLSSIAQRMYDFRQGVVAPPTASHVERWVRQFDAADQPIAAGA